MLYLDKEKCIGCGLCAKDCWFGAISMQDGKAASDYSLCFKCGHCIAICPQNCFSLDDYGPMDTQQATYDITPDQLLNFIKSRRTIRHFLSKPVESKVMEQVLQAGRFTQTGGNQQKVAYIIVQDKLQELRKLAIDKLYGMSQQLMDAEDPTLRRYAGIWQTMHDDYEQDPNGRDKLFLKAPMLLIVTSPSAIDGGLASANIANMIDATPGLGTCFSGFFTRAASGDPVFHEFLGIKPGYNICSSMMVGYHNTKYQRTVPRKPTDISWI